MISKFTSLILLWLTTIIVAIAQPELQYCLCLDKVFISNCECDTLTDPEHCFSESCESIQKIIEGKDTQLIYLSCSKECSTLISIQTDSFLFETLSLKKKPSKLIQPNLLSSNDLPFILLNNLNLAIKEYIPAINLAPNVPYHLRYSVFLI